MWPFKRKPKPINPGPINEDWAYGDLAQCVSKGKWTGDGIGPDNGDVSKVLSVLAANGPCGDGWFLELAGFPGRFLARSFRKVPPLNSEADASFTAQIRACKPAKVPA